MHPGPRDLVLPGFGSGVALSRSLGTCVTRARVPESCAFLNGRPGGGGSHGAQWRQRRRRRRRQGQQGARSLDAAGGLRAGRLGQATGRRRPARTLGRDLTHSRGAGDSRRPAGPSTPRHRVRGHKHTLGAAQAAVGTSRRPTARAARAAAGAFRATARIRARSHVDAVAVREFGRASRT